LAGGVFWPKIRALLREPLLHFLLIGLALFLLYGRVSPGDSDSRRIVITQVQVDEMARQFQAVSNRPPTSAEIRGLIDTYVRDEIVYREGLSLGLDKDDAVIKRRIRQKYDLISEEEESSDPTDEKLLAYLKAHRETFVQPAVVSFDQIFFDPVSTRPEAVDAAKAALAKGADPGAFGQPSLLPGHVEKSAIDLIARDFGEDFARYVGAAPVGHWVGPVVSAIGVHLVRVRKRDAAQLPPLNRIRRAVEREWENANRVSSRDSDYEKLRAEYNVVVRAKLPVAPQP
jgi:hypothetical protein